MLQNKNKNCNILTKDKQGLPKACKKKTQKQENQLREKFEKIH